MMQTDLEQYLSKLETAKRNRRAALSDYDAARAAYAEAFSPLSGKPTFESLFELYGLCTATDGFSRSNIFVTVALLCYDPEALYGGKIKLRVAKLIAQVLGVTHSSVYIARKKVSAWLNIYPTFRLAVGRVFKEYTIVSIV